MNYLLVLMLAYFMVSLGSVLLSMRTTLSYVFGLMSLLYLLLAVGLALFFFSQLLSLPKPINPAFLAEASETDVRPASPQEHHAGPRSKPLANADERQAVPRGKARPQAAEETSHPYGDERRRGANGGERYETSSAASLLLQPAQYGLSLAGIRPASW
ncbi:MAG: hypothetical protein BGO62_09020 [Thiobacillus sp. 65-1402]|nr:MAG: hypothetical protein BGO62_09020 [Thiobacillus sp. 65-1402]